MITKIKDEDINVKEYLPINDKLKLIANVLNNSIDVNSFMNPVRVKVMSSLEIIYFYTDMSFTEEEKEDVASLYDKLETAGIFNEVFNAIPKDEYNFVIKGINDTIESYYNYKNSAMGIIDSIVQNYSELEIDANDIIEKLNENDSMKLLKDVVTKLG